ncbi:tetratricopeptide repeat protein [Sulfurospirillum sp. 1307]|jgi:tetratricopeptide (TPR) repeat protein
MRILLFVIFITSISQANVNVVCKAGVMDDDNAKKYISKVLKKEPKNVECILKLASVYLKSGDILKGYNQVVKAYHINPKAVKSSDFNNILDSALEIVNLARKAKKTKDAELWNLVGNNFSEMGAFKDAAYAYEKSLKINPNQPKITIKLALCYQRCNKVFKAINLLRKMIKEKEDNFFANYYLAKIIRYDLRDEVESWEFFQRAKTILEVNKHNFKKEEYALYLEDIENELSQSVQ